MPATTKTKQIKIFTTDSGQEYTGVLIHNGYNMKLYEKLDDPDIMYVYSRSDNIGPEIIWLCQKDNHHPYITRMDAIDVFAGNTYDWHLYETDRVEPLTSTHPARPQFLLLRDIYKEVYDLFVDEYPWEERKDNWYRLYEWFIESCRDTNDIPRDMIETFEYLESWSTAFGASIRVDITKRSVRTRGDGLIFWDIFQKTQKG